MKAGVVLVPLMGIANLVQSTYWPLEMNIIQLGNLSYLVTTLISFQGFFCSLIYCFLNRQVIEYNSILYPIITGRFIITM